MGHIHDTKPTRVFASLICLSKANCEEIAKNIQNYELSSITIKLCYRPCHSYND